MKKFILVFLLILLPVVIFGADAVTSPAAAANATTAPPEVLAVMPELVTPPVTHAPEWLVKALEVVSSVPVVGPVVVEVAKWLGVLSSVLTILVTAILAVLRVLTVVLPAVRLAGLVSVVAAVENSKVLYWLKLFSMYNAKQADQEKKV